MHFIIPPRLTCHAFNFYDSLDCLRSSCTHLYLTQSIVRPQHPCQQSLATFARIQLNVSCICMFRECVVPLCPAPVRCLPSCSRRYIWTLTRLPKRAGGCANIGAYARHMERLGKCRRPARFSLQILVRADSQGEGRARDIGLHKRSLGWASTRVELQGFPARLVCFCGDV